MNNIGTAYVLWLGCLLQIHGLQRLYNGKIFTGLLWMFTLGLFGVGQLLDLLLIPGMVEDHNAKLKGRSNTLPYATKNTPVIERVVTREFSPTSIAKPEPDCLIVKLVKAAHGRSGKLTVTQGVMDTEASFEAVESALRKLVKTGYVDAYNDPETGVVTYDFREL